MILGLNGKIGAGKNTVAERLAILSPVSVVELSYAAALKQSFAALFGVTVKQLEQWKNNPAARITISAPGGHHYQVTVREGLQRYGDESHRRIFGEDFWIRAAHDGWDLWIKETTSPTLYVVTDVRYQNEADRIRELGGTVARVVGPNDNTGSHASERLLRADITIKNKVRDDDFQALDAELWPLVANLFPGSDAKPSHKTAANTA